MTALQTLRVWLLLNRGTALTVLGLMVSCLAFAWATLMVILRGEFSHMWLNLIAVAAMLSWVTLATTPVRTIGPRDVLRGFLAGFFLTMLLSYTLATTATSLFGDNNTTVGVLIPLVEEFAKLAALLLLLWTLNRRYARASGVSDLVLLGLAVGSGFAVHEDTLYPRTMAAIHTGTIREMFTKDWGMVFPTIFHYEGVTTMGHPGWGLTIGFGVGIMLLLRRHRLLAALLVLSTYGTAVAIHAAWNHGSVPDVVSYLIGRTEPWSALTMLAIAVGIDLLRQRHRPPAVPAPRLTFYRGAVRLGEGFWQKIQRLIALTRYRREWLAAAYARSDDHHLHDLSEDPGLISWFLAALRPSPAAASPTAPRFPESATHRSGPPPSQ